jgi:hypothetical protein
LGLHFRGSVHLNVSDGDVKSEKAKKTKEMISKRADERNPFIIYKFIN